MNLSKLMIFNIALLIVLCYLIVGSDSALLKRSPSETTSSSTEAITTVKTSTTSKYNTRKPQRKKDSICGIKNICGWAIYNRKTRFIDYFMEADCECEPTQECFKSEDDISLSAYVYRCKVDQSDKS